MPKVLADNEEVVFQEGIPEEPLHIYELLMGAFAEQRRSVVKFTVDGKDALQSGDFAKSFELIEAESLSHDEITLRLSIDFINQMNTLEDSILAYQINILTTPWSEVFKQMDLFIQKIQPFADLIDHVSPYAQSYSPPWKDRIDGVAKAQAETLARLLTSFENFDPAGLSEELENGFIPLFRNAIKLFSEDIIPYLKAETEKATDETSNA
ncbi:MAG: hypothetical protein P8P49_07360 [Opitutales bacterium]|nr:hypothetical protein [Opitutales bacterium]